MTLEAVPVACDPDGRGGPDSTFQGALLSERGSSHKVGSPAVGLCAGGSMAKMSAITTLLPTRAPCTQGPPSSNLRGPGSPSIASILA